MFELLVGSFVARISYDGGPCIHIGIVETCYTYIITEELFVHCVVFCKDALLFMEY